VLAIRVLQGLGSSVSETVAVATVGDMFFVHERGTKMVRKKLKDYWQSD